MCCYSTVLNLKKKKHFKWVAIEILCYWHFIDIGQAFFIVVLGDKICVIFEFFIHSFIPVIIISFPRYFF